MSSLPITHEELSDLIGIVYDSAFEDPQWKSLLQRLHRLFPEIGGCTVAWEGDTLQPPVVAVGGETLRFWSEAIECAVRTLDNMGALESFRTAPNGFIGRTEAYFDDVQYRQSALYRASLGPSGYCHAQHLLLDQRDGRGAFLSIVFPDNAEAHERLYRPVFELMKLLSPHCVRAFQLARMLTLSRQANEALGGFLDTVILPMIVTDGAGRTVFANAAGRRMLDRGDAIRLTPRGDVALCDPEDSRELLAKIAETERDLAAGGMRTWDGDDPLVMCLTPFRPSLAEANPLDRHLLEEERLVAIFIGQPPGDAINPRLLRDVYDLTEREADVAVGLIVGRSPAEIAEASGRALKTVRNQIQTVYDKVGVASNAQLLEALSVFRTVGTMFDAEAVGIGRAGEPLLREDRA